MASGNDLTAASGAGNRTASGDDLTAVSAAGPMASGRTAGPGRLVIRNCTAAEFDTIWRPYLDLDRDYGSIKHCLTANDPIMNFAFAKGFDKREVKDIEKRIDEAPFDSGRKMMSTVHTKGDGFIQYTKGAPDEILARCTKYIENGDEVPMTPEKKAEFLAANKEMADKALRVLAGALRYWETRPEQNTPEYLEQDMTFIGLTGMPHKQVIKKST